MTDRTLPAKAVTEPTLRDILDLHSYLSDRLHEQAVARKERQNGNV